MGAISKLATFAAKEAIKAAEDKAPSFAVKKTAAATPRATPPEIAAINRFAVGAGVITPETAKLIHQLATYGRNPVNAAKQLVAAGKIDLASKDSVSAEIARIRALRASRQTARAGNDPLDLAAIHRPRTLERNRSIKPFANSPMAAEWDAARREEILSMAPIDRFGAEAMARLATVEAITRQARKDGLTVRHTSTGRSGRVTSRYINVPGIGEVRVSDHALPETPQRQYGNDLRGGPRWDNEIITDDWSYTPLDDYMKRLSGVTEDEAEDAVEGAVEGAIETVAKARGGRVSPFKVKR